VQLHGSDDDHATLSPMRLALSPGAKYLLVALDGPRMLMLRTSDWGRVRAFYGLHVAQFHNHGAHARAHTQPLVVGGLLRRACVCVICLHAGTSYPQNPPPTTQPTLKTALAWHRDSFYIYASADGAAVHVYHVGTGKVVARLEGQHRVNVRDLDVDHGRNLLATCSFDKTVRVFGGEVTPTGE